MSDFTPDSTPTKQCSKCGEEKPATSEHFAKCTRAKDSLDWHCKACTLAYRVANKALIAENNREYYKANKEKINKVNQAYRNAHKKEATERDRKYREANKERLSESQKQYWDSRKGMKSERDRKYRESNREKLLVRKRKYYENNRDKSFAASHNRRALKRNAEGKHTAADVKRQHKAQKGRCYYCKCKVGKTYHIDHVIPLARGGSNGPENIVIACPTCNLSKNDRLPHEWPQGGRLL